ncbi:MAG: hypothetical protein LBG59_00960 [Candidatus Peribacteria bacterium]|jgi:hypothetical protein|nr:hypothetical protein [Candidatus Peribacteria bacterium]
MFSSLLRLTNVYSKPVGMSKDGILKEYCKGMLSSDPLSGQFSIESEDEYAFSSQTSLFVYALCRAWNEELVATSPLREGVFKEKFVEKLALQQWEGTREDRKDVCRETGNRLHCDMSRYSFKIYTTLMSDIFKIKWAHMAGVRSTGESDTTARIAEVFQTYFKKKEADLSAFQKDFPKTSSMIVKNQTHFQKSLSSVVMLDNDSLDASASKECSSPEVSVSVWKCGLHMNGDHGMNQHFLHLIYNEYLNYRIFIDYYTNQLSRAMKSDENGRENVTYRNELETLSVQRALLETSLKTALEEFGDFVNTYMLHIGLGWYQEALLEFRDKYAVKIVPPFYTLYQKLRNVQPVS